MEREVYIDRIEDLKAEQIADGIARGVISFDELRKTGEFDASKQKSVRALLRKKDDDAFANADTVVSLEDYIAAFPNGHHVEEAARKIQQLLERDSKAARQAKERREMLGRIREDINEYTTDEILNILSEEDLEALCEDIGIDVQLIRNFREPELRHNDIPENESDIPSGYTDVFFWGIPSSGKTCALAAIFSTIKRDYSMEAPDCEKKYGATYRDSLVNIFRNDFGYLPGRTNTDQTQYMPFQLYRRGEKNKKRKVSFFELSGEVFKYFYEVANSSHIIDEYKRENVEQSFQTLRLLLKSDNQKIHFFFIDYNQETKHTEDSNGLTQSNYLEAAATYFRDNKDIFKKKTDAVYVVITKSDEIPDEDKTKAAREFLSENFGSFMDVLKNQCKRYSVDFNVKLFSIGDVYFKRICKIDRAYSKDIINNLLDRIKPSNNSLFRNFFNS